MSRDVNSKSRGIPREESSRGRKGFTRGRSGNEGGTEEVAEVPVTRLCGESWSRMRAFYFFLCNIKSHWTFYFLSKENHNIK